jgi:hypothetical protein
LSRACELLFETTRKRMTSELVIEELEKLSFSIQKMTVVVLDNARVHTLSAGARASSVLATARVVHLLLTALFAASEHRRKVVAQTEI